MASKTTTITLTASEMALLFSIVSQAMDEPAVWSKPMQRVARSMYAKCTAALIATQREVGS